jgi:hypothetical protein
MAIRVKYGNDKTIIVKSFSEIKQEALFIDCCNNNLKKLP